MATPETQASEPDEDPAGTFRLTAEEIEELDEADREYEADEAAGRTRPAREFLDELEAQLLRS